MAFAALMRDMSGAVERAWQEGLLKESQAPQVILSPAGLVLEHPFEGFRAKGFTRTVEGNRHPTAVRVTVVLVGS